MNKRAIIEWIVWMNIAHIIECEQTPLFRENIKSHSRTTYHVQIAAQRRVMTNQIPLRAKLCQNFMTVDIDILKEVIDIDIIIEVSVPDFCQELNVQ